MDAIKLKDDLFLIKDFLDEDTQVLYEEILGQTGLGKCGGGRKMLRMTNPGMKYTIEGKPYPRKDYTDLAARIRSRVDGIIGATEGYFNTCTFNYYPDGKSGWRPHTDYMSDLVPPMIVCTYTLGHSNRSMDIIPMRGRKALKVPLPDNSLLVMGPGAQSRWLHSIPKTREIVAPRLSLSFRRQWEPRDR
jgi:alkylated DNA repair dioxygenase AlkB